MSIDDGGPAFGGSHDEPGLERFVHDDGMSLRDYYAGQAMLSSRAGLVDIDNIEGGGALELLAKNCYFLADAMIARKREGEKS